MLHLASACLAKAANGGGGCAHSSGFRRVFTPPADGRERQQRRCKAAALQLCPARFRASSTGTSGMSSHAFGNGVGHRLRALDQVGERVEVAGTCPIDEVVETIRRQPLRHSPERHAPRPCVTPRITRRALS